MGRRPDPHAQAVCWVLHCGDQPVAFSAHLETDTALYVLANSYDEQWKSHSPLALSLPTRYCAMR